MKNPSHIKGITPQLDLMYKFIGFALMGVVAMMMIPGNFNALQGEQPALFYGAGTATLLDSQGNEQFSQTIHNLLVDTGEDFLLDATFQDGATDVADNVQIGSICISTGTIVVSETRIATDFDTANALTEANCKEDTLVGTTGSVATVNPATFTCGETNCTDNDIITGFAVCQNDVTDDLDFINCATEGIMFAIIDLSPDITLALDETLDITYTFDVTSGSN